MERYAKVVGTNHNRSAHVAYEHDHFCSNRLLERDLQSTDASHQS